jgi:hypothetical protein
MFSRTGADPILIGVAAIAELGSGLLRHAFTLLWPRDGVRLKIVSLATI